MQTMLSRGSSFIAFVALIFFAALLIPWLMDGMNFTGLNSLLPGFKATFLGIILEAFPFILLGVFLSSLLQVFVTEAAIKRLVPKQPLLAVIFACVVGIIFPICECGSVPVVRRLMNKGMPAYVAVTFLLAGPIINPVVFAATYMAFRARPEIAYGRMGLAFAATVTIGLILYRLVRSNPLRQADHTTSLHSHSHAHDHIHDHIHDHSHDHSHSGRGVLSSVLSHAADEFFEMGKYLILGALITSIIQVAVDRGTLLSLGQSGPFSHLFMAGFAYVLSLCSTSDAFVASSFAQTFSTGSLLTFLVFGPMIDLKGTLMLLSTFKARFVLLLLPLTVAVVLACSMTAEALHLW